MRGEMDLEFKGQRHKITYVVARDTITVRSAFDEKSTQLGGTPAEVLARMIGKELLCDAYSKGFLD